MKKMVICLFILLNWPMIAAANQPAGFYDDFTNGLNPQRWILINRQWGGNNGGVSAQNVHWVNQPDHHLELVAHGNLYHGNVTGFNGMKIRVGSAIATRDYYGSGDFSVCVRLPNKMGVGTGFWLFHFLMLQPNDPDFIPHRSGLRNSEIDWETPVQKFINEPASYNYARTNSWGGQTPGEDIYFSQIVNLAPYNHGKNPAFDGKFHKYEIIWQTGNNLANGIRLPASITWLFAADCSQPGHIVNQLVGTSSGKDNIPFYASRFWIGLNFPVDNKPNQRKYAGWAGNANFGSTRLAIKWINIIPFYYQNNRDTWRPETNPSNSATLIPRLIASNFESR